MPLKSLKEQTKMEKAFKVELYKYDAKGKYKKLLTLNDTKLQAWKKHVEEIALTEYHNLKVKLKKGK